jgi:hypothetical protein
MGETRNEYRISMRSTMVLDNIITISMRSAMNCKRALTFL